MERNQLPDSNEGEAEPQVTRKKRREDLVQPTMTQEARNKRKRVRDSHEQHTTGEITRTHFEEDWELKGASVVGFARIVATQDDELNLKNRQLQELSRQLDETKAQWEGARTRTPTDEEISRRFTRLKSHIMQFVRLRSTPTDMTGPSGESEDDAADELLELERRKEVAQQLHNDFFDTDILLQIYSTPAASGQSFEKQLRENGCPESLISARRTANIKACTSLSSFREHLYDFALEKCKAFWHGRCSSWTPPPPSDDSPELQIFGNTAKALFRRAARLAIYLQTLRVEYKWEQVNRLQSTPITRRDDEIVGAFGRNPTENQSPELAFVVFGGVVRGDKITGLLANGNVRLLKSHIVIQQQVFERLAHGGDLLEAVKQAHQKGARTSLEPVLATPDSRMEFALTRQLLEWMGVFCSTAV
ncbi:hypothetical protein B0T18DRAFT_389335 [Schizothecium vesticola]|uniref:Uncharacterized protein n=1 Tax=Schizothecium vesticola TaxID=314040 RepID=A0AA40K8D8_9PEZI|nr:hypothetical protein B0T18DRAFT_389335 [Schizothecium vesticola]